MIFKKKNIIIGLLPWKLTYDEKQRSTQYIHNSTRLDNIQRRTYLAQTNIFHDRSVEWPESFLACDSCPRYAISVGEGVFPSRNQLDWLYVRSKWTWKCQYWQSNRCITPSYLLLTTWMLPKPVTIAFVSDELMLTGPSPWKILMRFNLNGSIVSISVNPSTPVINKMLHFIETLSVDDWLKTQDLSRVWQTASEYFLWSMLQIRLLVFGTFVWMNLQGNMKRKALWNHPQNDSLQIPIEHIVI